MKNKIKTFFQGMLLLCMDCTNVLLIIARFMIGAANIVFAFYFFSQFILMGYISVMMLLGNNVMRLLGNTNVPEFYWGGIIIRLILFILAAGLLFPPTWIPYKIMKYVETSMKSLTNNLRRKWI